MLAGRPVAKRSVFSIRMSSPPQRLMPWRWLSSHTQLRMTTFLDDFPFHAPITMPSPPDETKRMFCTTTFSTPQRRNV